MKTAALAVVAVLLALQASGMAAGAASKKKTLDIRTLSTRADRISGGDVLVEIAPPAAAAPVAADAAYAVSLDGRDVSSAFRRQNGSLVGLVTGLVVGPNQLRASAWGVSDQRIALTNYPIAGPIVSGPHPQPFVCQTEAF